MNRWQQRSCSTSQQVIRRGLHDLQTFTARAKRLHTNIRLWPLTSWGGGPHRPPCESPAQPPTFRVCTLQRNNSCDLWSVCSPLWVVNTVSQTLTASLAHTHIHTRLRHHPHASSLLKYSLLLSGESKTNAKQEIWNSSCCHTYCQVVSGALFHMWNRK